MSNKLAVHVKFIKKGDYRLPRNLDMSLFTVAELGIIAKYGNWLKAIEDGTLSPITNAQREFLSVCEGVKIPVTPFAIAWKKLKDAASNSGGAATSDSFPGREEVSKNVWSVCPDCRGRKPNGGTCPSCAGTGWLWISFHPTMAHEDRSNRSRRRRARSA